MNILTIPLRCVRQKWPRALALLGIFMLGAAAIVALQKVSAAVGEGFEKKLAAFGANIIISPKRETLTISYGGITLGDMLVDEGRIPVRPALKAIRGIPLRDRIAVVAPKRVGLARVDGKPVPVVGVDFDQELDLKRFWAVDGVFPGESEKMPANGVFSGQDIGLDKSENQVLAGHALAERLGLAPGAKFRLGSETADVAGVLQLTGSDDDNVLFMPLGLAQRLLGVNGGADLDGADFVEVAALCSGCPIEDIVAELKNALPDTEVKALRQVVAQRMYAIHFAQDLALLVALVILVCACAMVAMSMLSAVNERRREIGVLRAVGYSRGGIFVIFASEALAIGVAAGILGYAAGCLTGESILTGLHLEAATLPPFSTLEMLACGLVAGLIATASAAFPAWKAGLVDPAQALTAL